MEQLRQHFSDELEQLRLQVELMAVRVEANLESMRHLLRTGDPADATRMLDADDAIDAMSVSLTERCYELLMRQAPVARDFRFVVSVLRVLPELERIGDLTLRLAKLAPDHHLLVANPGAYDVLICMADDAIDTFRSQLQVWSTLTHTADRVPTTTPVDHLHDHLMQHVLRYHGADANRAAVVAFAASRALDRIIDHVAIIEARIRYLVTGDPRYLAAEVR